MIVIDDSLLLIEPSVAKNYRESIKPPEICSDEPGTGVTIDGSLSKQTGQAALGGGMMENRAKGRFYGCVEIDPINAKLAFSEVVDEVVAQFTPRLGTKVVIKVEIEAQDPKGFEESLQRTVRENCNTLRFSPAEFEKE